jgi:hypothetical protein
MMRKLNATLHTKADGNRAPFVARIPAVRKTVKSYACTSRTWRKAAFNAAWSGPGCVNAAHDYARE